jgi:hypothetical protein
MALACNNHCGRLNNPIIKSGNGEQEWLNSLYCFSPGKTMIFVCDLYGSYKIKPNAFGKPATSASSGHVHREKGGQAKVFGARRKAD